MRQSEQLRQQAERDRRGAAQLQKVQEGANRKLEHQRQEQAVPDAPPPQQEQKKQRQQRQPRENKQKDD